VCHLCVTGALMFDYHYRILHQYQIDLLIELLMQTTNVR
jgi:hypothetical protein